MDDYETKENILNRVDTESQIDEGSSLFPLCISHVRFGIDKLTRESTISASLQVCDFPSPRLYYSFGLYI